MNSLARHTFIFLLMFGISNVNAAEDCENEGSWSAVRACLEIQKMAHLNAVYQDTLSFVKRDNAKAAELLKDAQKAWLNFAEKSCDFTSASRLPNSNDFRFGCWLSFINAREKVLKAYKRDHGKEPIDVMNP